MVLSRIEPLVYFSCAPYGFIVENGTGINPWLLTAVVRWPLIIARGWYMGWVTLVVLVFLHCRTIAAYFDIGVNNERG